MPSASPRTPPLHSVFEGLRIEGPEGTVPHGRVPTAPEGAATWCAECWSVPASSPSCPGDPRNLRWDGGLSSFRFAIVFPPIISRFVVPMVIGLHIVWCHGAMGIGPHRLLPPLCTPRLGVGSILSPKVGYTTSPPPAVACSKLESSPKGGRPINHSSMSTITDGGGKFLAPEKRRYTVRPTQVAQIRGGRRGLATGGQWEGDVGPSKGVEREGWADPSVPRHRWGTSGRPTSHPSTASS